MSSAVHLGFGGQASESMPRVFLIVDIMISKSLALVLEETVVEVKGWALYIHFGTECDSRRKRHACGGIFHIQMPLRRRITTASTKFSR